MIFYFSGTGNSLHVAKTMLSQDEQLVSISKVLNQKEFDYVLNENESLGFIFPVYFYTLPSIVREFVSHLTIKNTSYVYAIITCGGSIKQAGNVLKKELSQRNIQLNYVKSIVMPDNSMLFYQIPTGKKVEQRLEKVNELLVQIKNEIISKKEMEIHNQTFISDLIGIGYQFSKKTSKFHVLDSCIGCGLCKENCPQNVIDLVDGKPQWLKEECCKCSGCINRCPVQAIQYGKATLKRNRYIHPNLK